MFWFFHCKKTENFDFLRYKTALPNTKILPCAEVFTPTGNYKSYLDSSILNVPYGKWDMSINLKSPFASTITVRWFCWSLSCLLARCPCWHWESREKGSWEESGILEAILLDKHPEGLNGVIIQAPVCKAITHQGARGLQAE